MEHSFGDDVNVDGDVAVSLNSDLIWGLSCERDICYGRKSYSAGGIFGWSTRLRRMERSMASDEAFDGVG